MRTINSHVRKCGKRIPGGIYLTSEGSKFGSLPLWVSLTTPIPCEDRFHRGPVLVDAEAVLKRLPEEEWYVGSSEAHRQKLKSDEWAIDRFGMTTTLRFKIGVAAGSSGADEAMDKLFGSVKWNPEALSKTIMLLTEQNIAEIPQVTEHYAALISHIQDFPGENTAMSLIKAVAATWRIAEALPPLQKIVIVPNLMRLLVVLGVHDDAWAMRERYGV
jgi:hypothetical protein